VRSTRMRSGITDPPRASLASSLIVAFTGVVRIEYSARRPAGFGIPDEKVFSEGLRRGSKARADRGGSDRQTQYRRPKLTVLSVITV